MNTPNFIFLSELIGLPVVDASRNYTIGRVTDLSAELKELYPKICAISVRTSIWKAPQRIPWSNVRLENKRIVAELPDPHTSVTETFPEQELPLREVFLDKQIVDIEGSKVVRVNDLHLLQEKTNLWIIHMDIGSRGFLRRLGWLKAVNWLTKWLFDYEIKDKYIPWKYVHPIMAGEMKPLSLKIPQSKLADLHPADLADILEDMGTSERLSIFQSFDPATAAETLEEFPSKLRMQVAELLDEATLADILKEMPMDEKVDLLDELPGDKSRSLIRFLPQEEVKQIKTLMKLSDYSAGSIMNTEYIALSSNTPVKKVFDVLREQADTIESVYYIYVVDENESLTGVFTLKQLLTAGPEETVADLMRKKVISVSIDTHIKKVARIFLKYNFVVVPVVDDDNRIAGIITIKDSLEAVFPEIQEEMEETS